jgi:hypothetical protein
MPALVQSTDTYQVKRYSALRKISVNSFAYLPNLLLMRPCRKRLPGSYLPSPIVAGSKPVTVTRPPAFLASNCIGSPNPGCAFPPLPQFVSIGDIGEVVSHRSIWGGEFRDEIRRKALAWLSANSMGTETVSPEWFGCANQRRDRLAR